MAVRRGAAATVVVALAAGLLTLAAPPADGQSGEIVVTTAADVVNAADGVLSLREAIDQANAHAGDDTISLAAGATYTLTRCDGGSSTGNDNRGGDLDHRDRVGALIIAGHGAEIVGGSRCPNRVLHSRGTGLVRLDDLTIRGGQIDPSQRPLPDSLDGGGVLVAGDLTLQRSVVRDNEAGGWYGEFGAGRGGGLVAEGDIVLLDSEIAGNRAGWGGGAAAPLIFSRRSDVHDNAAVGAGGLYARYAGGAVRLRDGSRVHANRSGCGGARGASFVCYGGGGISAQKVVVRGGSSVYGNHSTAPGGGIEAPSVTVIGSSVRDNTSMGAGWGGYFGDQSQYALGGGGAGISAGELTLVRSTVAGNVLHVSDGGVFEGAASGAGIRVSRAVVEASTISGNRAIGTAMSVGGLRVDGSLTMINSTVSGNAAELGDGAGVSVGDSATLTHTTVVRNRGPAASNLAVAGPLTLDRSLLGHGQSGSTCALSGPVTSLGYNVEQIGLPDQTCGVGAGPGDQVGVPTLGLGPLAANGGPTRTHLALAAAVHAVPLAACSIVADQRGFVRPQGDACEAGAVEIP